VNTATGLLTAAQLGVSRLTVLRRLGKGLVPKVILLSSHCRESVIMGNIGGS